MSSPHREEEHFLCVCGKSYNTNAGLKQHQRRYCRSVRGDRNGTRQTIVDSTTLQISTGLSDEPGSRIQQPVNAIGTTTTTDTMHIQTSEISVKNSTMERDASQVNLQCSKCGKTFKVQATLTNHIRRFCKGAPPEAPTTGPEKCTYCSRSFGTFAGMRQHVKQGHVVEYNMEMEEEAKAIKLQRWTENEEETLAAAVAKYVGKDLIGYLTSISKRSKEGIKGKLKSPKFKERVARLKEQLESAPEIAADGDITGPSEGIGTAEEPNESEDSIRLYLTKTLETTTDPEDRELLQFVCGNEEGKMEKLDLWTQKLTEKYGEEPKKTTPRNNEKDNSNAAKNNRRKRAAEYRLAQIEFRENRQQYARRLLDGKEEDSTQTPAKDQIEEEYRRIFGSTPPPDSAPIEDAKEEEYNAYSQITPEDIEWAIRTTKSDAAGPDGITKRRLRKIKVSKLEVLFNCILFLQHLPKPMRASRTILVPKTPANLENISNWRPLTISSILLRTLNKIVARRLAHLEIDTRQRGFTKIDGCLANNLTVQAIIKQRRKEGRPYVIITLDLAKAFDSVSIENISRALHRQRVDRKTREYIRSNYMDITTNISCEGKEICDIQVTRGVKQGDPMSPVLFNIIMDELVCKINRLTGIKLGQSNIACLAYADDLVLIASSIEDAETLLNICVNFLKERGLSINAKKCTALATRIVPSKKKLAVITEDYFQIENTTIPAIGMTDFFKYLGLKFSFEGTQITTGTLCEQLARVRRAPLKPQQKMSIIRDHLIPRYIASLQHPAIHMKTLKEADRKIRNSIKRILHLPQHCNNAIIYATMKDGGLGIFNFHQRIPLILNNRIEVLHNTGQMMQDVLNNSGNMIHRLRTLTPRGISKTSEVHALNACQLEQSFSGNGMGQMSNHRGCNTWMVNPPIYWTGEDYIKAIQLRFNMLPTMCLPYTPMNQRGCRAGCLKTESLSHVLQNCPLVHWKRIQRHNYVVKRIKDHAARKGWKVVLEPNIRCQDGNLKKPDLQLEKDDKIIIADVQINWEGPRSLTESYYNKQAIYSSETFINTLNLRFPGKTIYILPLIVGARGAWCPKNKFLTDHLELEHAVVADIITTVLRGGWSIHRDFMRAVWRQRR